MASGQRLARGSLDRERILRAALKLGEEVGLAALSIPALAARLEVGVSSIYWHVHSRDELILAMSQRAIGRLDALLPTPDGWAPADWRRYLHAYFTRQRAVFASDDLLTDLTVMRTTQYDPKTLNEGFPGVERVLRYLVAAGFAPVDAWNLYCALSMYNQGFAVVERRSRDIGVPLDVASQAEKVDAELTPIIAELIRTGAASIDLAGDATYEAGLQWLLNGPPPGLQGDGG